MLPLNYTMTRALQEDREREIASLGMVARRRYATTTASVVRHWLTWARRSLNQAGRPKSPVGRPERARSYGPG